MSLSYMTVFELPSNYDINQLNDIYKLKKNSILQNNNLSCIDKEIYIDNLNKYYREARQDYHRRELFNLENYIPKRIRNFHSIFNDDNLLFDHNTSVIDNDLDIKERTNYTSSTSTTYRECLMNDGSTIVVNEGTTNKNGNVTVKTKCYRRLSNGVTEDITYKDAMEQIRQIDKNSEKVYEDTKELL